MKHARFGAAAFIVMVSVGLAATLAQQPPPGRPSPVGPLALVGGTLIDGAGGPVVRNSVVLIRGDRIERDGTVESVPVPPGHEVTTTHGQRVDGRVCAQHA